MNKLLSVLLLTLLVSIVLALPVFAVTNVLINGANPDTITSGSEMRITFDFEGDTTANMYYYIDTNNNAILDSSDYLVPDPPEVLTDGDENDLDGIVNGSYEYNPEGDGPQWVIGTFHCEIIDNGGSGIGTLTVIPAGNTYGVAGTVLVPPNTANLMIFMSNDSLGINYMDLTDENGDYGIWLPDTLAGTEWSLMAMDFMGVAPDYAAPPNQGPYVINTFIDTIDFEFIEATAWIEGYILDETDEPIAGTQIGAVNADTWDYYMGISDSTGFYSIGVAPSKTNYYLNLNEDALCPDYIIPELWNATISVLEGDTTIVNITLLIPDTIIYGIITENDNLPEYAYRFKAITYSDTLGYDYYNVGFSEIGDSTFTISVKNSLIKVAEYDVYEYGSDCDEENRDYYHPACYGFIWDGDSYYQGITSGETVHFRLKSANAHIIGNTITQIGDPEPDYEHYSIGLYDASWNYIANYNLDSDGTFDILCDAATYHIRLEGNNQWLHTPSEIENIIVDTDTSIIDLGEAFEFNYGHCTITGNLIGTDGVNWDNHWMYLQTNDENYETGGTINSDGNYTMWACEDTAWTLYPPYVDGYEASPAYYEFNVMNDDTLMEYDFTYNITDILLLSFIAQVDNGKVILNWETAGDEIAYYHLIRTDGAIKEDINTNSYIDRTVKIGIIENYEYELYAITLEGSTIRLGSIKVNMNELLPNEYSLKQNYPNPFNPITNIHYTLPEQTDVILNIYNIKGQLVRTLIKEKQLAGNYTVAWNGRTDDGTITSSGIYFYRLHCANFNQTKQMLLLK